MKITIVPSDIQRIGSLMGKDFSDNERQKILECVESCDIQACPGSGKTTAMVAKLVLVGEKLQGTNHGICALSHTNAARSEIEKSIGAHASSFLKYPNFIGTIQVFVDLFLAIPAYIQLYGKRPIIIDDDIYEIIAAKNYSSIDKNIRISLDKRLRNRKGFNFFCQMCYSFDNKEEIIEFDGVTEKPLGFGNQTKTYQALLKLKNLISSLGYLKYHDAFSYASWYVRKYPMIVKSLTLRFPFLFVDEMQDTNEYQTKLLESLFRDRSVIQRFGDSNQAIYSRNSEGHKQTWPSKVDFQITTSQRLSPSISNLIKSLGVQPQEIIGNPKRSDHVHSIILFTSKNISQVIPTFGNLIEKEGLKEGPFNALGSTGRLNIDPKNLSICSYWPNFARHRENKKTSSGFWGYICQAQNVLLRSQSFYEAKQKIVEGIVQILRSQDSRTRKGNYYSSAQFLKEIHDSGSSSHSSFNLLIYKWCYSLYKGNFLDPKQVHQQIQEVFAWIGLKLELSGQNMILDPPDVESQKPKADENIGNYYYHGNNIIINIDTVHGAKGQTHQATLLLETCFHEHDLQVILPFLKKEQKKETRSRVLTHHLPLCYVACSRPTHLLCLAIERDHVSLNDEMILKKVGWNIIELA